MTVKWIALSVALVIAVLTVVANLALRRGLPDTVNLLAGVFTGGMALTAYIAHLYGRINAKLDLTIELLVGRFEELENRIGTRKDE